MAEDCVLTPVVIVGYEAWPKGKVFVRVPNERGRYIMAPRCVVEVSCPHCKAIKGQPCFNPRTGRAWTSVHGDRSVLAPKRHWSMKDRPKPVYRAEDMVEKALVDPVKAERHQALTPYE